MRFVSFPSSHRPVNPRINRIVVDWRKVLVVPEGMGLDEAAGLYVTYPTSYAGLVNRAKTQSGEWVLVHAAAGGGAYFSLTFLFPVPH